ncbi:MAG: sulfatase [Myxococcota bacterium]|nr:sulfatase [Myxococcota bacterium]
MHHPLHCCALILATSLGAACFEQGPRPSQNLPEKAVSKPVLAPVLDKAAAPLPRPSAQRIVVVLVDTLRADGLGCYGYAKPTSPTIDRLAQQGVLFERAHAASPWTAPSFGSIFTGVSPTVHGAGEMLAKGSEKGDTLFGVTVGGIRSSLPTLPELMKEKMTTAGFVTNAFVSETLGFARGFAHFDHKNAALRRYRTADQVTDAALLWLKEHGHERYFLFLHYFDPHIQYGPPTQYSEQFAGPRPRRIAVPFIDHDAAREGHFKPTEEEKAFIRGLYDGEVRFVDDQIARIVEAVLNGSEEEPWIVVLSDHGEEHFDHGSFEHGHRYEEEVTRVPLIVRAPGGKWRAGQKVSTSVRHVDVPPTLLELVGATSPSHFEGRSLVSLMEGRDESPRKAYMEFNLFWGQQVALFDGRFKIVYDLRRKSSFLYDLEKDPGETQKLGKEHERHAELLGELLTLREDLAAKARQRPKNDAALSPEAAKALESLGYIKNK